MFINILDQGEKVCVCERERVSESDTKVAGISPPSVLFFFFFFALKHMHVHGGDLQHPAADGEESLLTHREREREGRGDRQGEVGEG